jgi:antitoxin HigA-1
MTRLRWRLSTTTKETANSEELFPGGRIPVSHPGETLREDFLLPLGKDARWLAEGVRLPLPEVQALLDEKCSVTAETALRLSRFLGTSAELWMGLQEHFDLETTQDRIAAELQEIQPHPEARAA